MRTYEDVTKKKRARGGGKLSRTRTGDGNSRAITDNDLRCKVRAEGSGVYTRTGAHV